MHANDTNHTNLDKLLHKTIKKVTEDIEGFRFNTAVSALMIFFNALEGNASTGRSDSEESSDSKSSANIDTCKTFLKLLAPFAPHITEELYQQLLGRGLTRTDTQNDAEGNWREPAFWSVHLEEWPEWDENMIQDETFQLVVQINGKVRATITAEKGISQEEAEKLARADERVLKYLGKPFDSFDKAQDKSAQGKKVKKVIFVEDRLVNFVLEES